MKRAILSMYDKKAREFGPLVLVATLEAGLRMVGDMLAAGGDSLYVTHPEDFNVRILGYFDQETGQFDLHPEFPGEVLVELELLARKLGVVDADQLVPVDEQTINEFSLNAEGV